MQSHKKITALLLAALALAAMTTVAGLRIQKQDKQATSKKERDAESYGPVVDFETPEATDPKERDLRHARGKRHDVSDKRFVLDEGSPSILLSGTWSHSPLEPALPVSQSDTILIGDVTSANAHLSNTKTNIYSEFDVRVEELLKNNCNLPLLQGDSIVVERFGGRVRLPPGKILIRGFNRKTLPRAGRRYLFFLKRNEEGEDFSILTGYELREGRVFPLDGVDIPQGGSKLPQFAPYDGVNEASFLTEVRIAITQQLP